MNIYIDKSVLIAMALGVAGYCLGIFAIQYGADAWFYHRNGSQESGIVIDSPERPERIGKEPMHSLGEH